MLPPRLHRFAARLFFAAAPLWLAACGTPFEVDLPDEPPRLVVQALFAADSVLTLGLVQSVSSVAPNGPSAAPVATAMVQIFEDGAPVGAAVYVPTPSAPGQGRYVSDVRPRAGRTYRVRIEAPGFAPVEAQDTVPQPTPFAVDVVPGAEPDDGADRVDAVTVRFAAPPDDAFHALYGLVERTSAGGADSVVPLTFRSTDPVLADGALTGLVFDFEEPFYQRALFRAPPDVPEVAVQISVRRTAVEAGGRVTERLRLATLSPTYYAYVRALDAGSADGAFETPRGLPSNVSGGYGVFAAFAATEQILP